jgi:hypothetical protein
MKRVVKAELLDQLPADDPGAIGSRRDIHRLNLIMGNLGTLFGMIETVNSLRSPTRVVELGSGDGTFMLRLAQSLSRSWKQVDVSLVDRKDVVTQETRDGFAKLGWSAHVITADVFDWLREGRIMTQPRKVGTSRCDVPTRVPAGGTIGPTWPTCTFVPSPDASLGDRDGAARHPYLRWGQCRDAPLLEASREPVDLIMANLFLHHFSGSELSEMLRLAAGRTRVFAACEPWRSRTGLFFSRMLRLIGCNAVTCHDAVASVQAGFAGRELSALWPAGREWNLRERGAKVFTHAFVAQRA